MKRIFAASASLCLFASAYVAGCDGDEIEVNETDAGPRSDASLAEAAAPDTGSTADGGKSDGSVDAGREAGSPYLLISVNGASSSELVVVRLSDKTVAGRLAYGGFIGLTTIDALGRPFLLQQQIDQVVELDPLEPWKPRASWDVRLTDKPDGGKDYADPVTVVPAPTPGKAYVLRFNRNRMAVIDDTLKGDASAPTKTIDLSSFFDPSDTDKSVDPVAAVRVGTKLYVLLANLDLNNVDPKGYFTICTAQKPKLVVLDTATDTFAPTFAPDAGALADGGTAPVVISLAGFNPVFGGLVLDAARNRLLAVNGGCNTQTADGGKGPLERRQVDAIDLTTGAVTKALDLNGEGFPSAIARAGTDELVLGFDFYGARRWTVTSSSLGAALPSGLTALATDPSGGVLGVVDTSMVDGGTAKEVVQVSVDGGVSTILASLPEAGGFVGAADFLPGQ